MAGQGHGEVIAKLFEYLVSHIDVKNTHIMDALVSNDVISLEQYSSVLEASQTNEDQVRRLLLCLRRKQRSDFECFLRILEQNQHDHVAKMLGDGMSGGLSVISRMCTEPSRVVEPDLPHARRVATAMPARHIEPCTVAFYEAHCPKSYPMAGVPKGVVLVISIKTIHYPGLRENRRRPTAEADLCRMSYLFKDLGYIVEEYGNVTTEELEQKMESFIKRTEDILPRSVFIVLMSRGEYKHNESYLVTCDGQPVPIRKTVERFLSSSSAPHLAPIPKIFIVQSCRGEQMSSGAPLRGALGMVFGSASANGENGGTAVSELRDNNSKIVREPEPFHYDADFGEVMDAKYDVVTLPGEKIMKMVPNFCNYYYAFASQPDYPAMVNIDKGSWFIIEIDKVFRQKAATYHISELMAEVRRNVSMEYYHEAQIFQLPEGIDGLNRPFYIFPGIK